MTVSDHPGRVLPVNLIEFPACVPTNHPSPERRRRHVLPSLSNLPGSLESIERSCRGGSPDSLSPVSSHDEELGHVEDAGGAGQSASLQDQREAGQLGLDAEQERMTPVFLPVRVERIVGEAPLVAHVERTQLAPIVRIELHQVLERDALFLGGRGQGDHVRGRYVMMAFRGTPTDVRHSLNPRVGLRCDHGLRDGGALPLNSALRTPVDRGKD